MLSEIKDLKEIETKLEELEIKVLRNRNESKIEIEIKPIEMTL